MAPPSWEWFLAPYGNDTISGISEDGAFARPPTWLGLLDEQRRGCLEESAQRLHEACRAQAVDHAMIERRREVHHAPRNDRAGAHHGPLDGAVDADDRDLGMIDHGCRDDAAQRAQARDRDRGSGK